MLFKLRDKDKKVNFRSKMNNRKRLKKNLKKMKGSSQSLNVFVFSFFNPVGCYSTAKIMFTFKSFFLLANLAWRLSFGVS